jgi:transcription-repair coupling factor (superfamily II helicase)
MLKIKFFKKIRVFLLDYISEKTVIFIQKTEDLFLQLDKQFAKARRKILKILSTLRQSNYFKSS